MVESHIGEVNLLLKSCATNANIASATSKIGPFVKPSNESAVQLADANCLTAVKCASAYPDRRTKKLFIDGLPLRIISGVQMFCNRELDTHLTELAQYANILLNSQHGHEDEFPVKIERFRGKGQLRCGAILATVERSEVPPIGI